MPTLFLQDSINHYGLKSRTVDTYYGIITNISSSNVNMRRYFVFIHHPSVRKTVYADDKRPMSDTTLLLPGSLVALNTSNSFDFSIVRTTTTSRVFSTRGNNNNIILTEDELLEIYGSDYPRLSKEFPLNIENPVIESLSTQIQPSFIYYLEGKLTENSSTAPSVQEFGKPFPTPYNNTPVSSNSLLEEYSEVRDFGDPSSLRGFEDPFSFSSGNVNSTLNLESESQNPLFGNKINTNTSVYDLSNFGTRVIEYTDIHGNSFTKTNQHVISSEESINIVHRDYENHVAIAIKRLSDLDKDNDVKRKFSSVSDIKTTPNGLEFVTSPITKNEFFEKLQQNYTEAEIDNILTQLERLKEVEKCIQQTVKQTRKKTRSLQQKLLDEIIEKGSRLILDELNNNLPGFLQVDIDLQKNEDGDFVVKSFKIGAVRYFIGEKLDGSEDYVEVDGEAFNPYIESAVGELNKILPDYLQTSANELGLSIGTFTIRKQDLKEDEIKEYRVRDDVVLLNNRGTLYLQMQGAKFNFGRVGDLFLDKGINKGISELNEELPDFLQASYRREGDVRIFDVGPFTITATGPEKGLYVDKERLRNTITGLPERLFNQLPAPLQPSARIIWKEATDYLVDDIFYKKDTERQRQQQQAEEKRQTIAAVQNSCLQDLQYKTNLDNNSVDVIIPKPDGSPSDISVNIPLVPETKTPPK